jgi:hypothetical protein
LTWGPQVEYLKGLEADGVVVQALRDRPVLEHRLRYYKDIFSELSDSRHYTANGAPLPIPITEFHGYCELFGIQSLDERNRLFTLIRVMDREFIKKVSADIKRDMDQASKRGQNNQP